MKNALGRCWTLLKQDVWEYPSIGALSGALLSALGLLLIWLTATYAPSAVEISDSASRYAGEAALSPNVGRLAIVLVVVATLALAFEPIVDRLRDRWWNASGRAFWMGRPRLIRTAGRWGAHVAFAPLKFSSAFWSLLDFLLARPGAAIAGCLWRNWSARYVHFGSLIAVSIAIACVSPFQFGTPAIAVALVSIISIVRRWAWVERDRDIFLVERGRRAEGGHGVRIGFSQDLRDEALIAIACLMLIVPISLDQLQQQTCAAGSCAFTVPFDDSSAAPLRRFYVWLGYFGVELAKTVPFVDWSEVFHVANGSPVEPQTVVGAQIAFVLRASLDLLLLAAVLQAMQIANRLREQRNAFRSHRLPILEPFSESLALSQLSQSFSGFSLFRPSRHPDVLKFPPYDVDRLRELIEVNAGVSGLEIQKAACAVLQKQYEASPSDLPKVAELWSACSAGTVGSHDQNWLLQVASGVDTDINWFESRTWRPRALRMIATADESAAFRSEAIRLLGRTPLSDSEIRVLRGLLETHADDVGVRAAAAVALMKSNVDPMMSDVSAIANSLKLTSNNATSIIAAMSTALAMRQWGETDDSVEYRFSEPLRQFVREAARIQLTPLTFADPSEQGEPQHWDRLRLVEPGTGPFPACFQMGASCPLSFQERAMPPRHVRLSRRFAMGEFPVTQREFHLFAQASGTPWKRLPGLDDCPATNLSWHDAVAYCAWMSSITGEQYRLPTEVEWEYCCRAGSDSSYSWGHAWEANKANSNRSSIGRPTPAGAYPPNEWGFIDMHGNVFEWCADPWHPDYREASPDEDVWLRNADFGKRVNRGGSWYSDPEYLASAARTWDNSIIAYNVIGFRVAKTVAN